MIQFSDDLYPTGCGNGKYLGVNPCVSTIGSDICPELVSIARTRGHEVAVFDCLHLPYRSSVFDAAICIAVVHHLSTEERRLAALRELVRIVRPGGRILVYVWAMEQERKKVCLKK
jgi:SAM-dependent methyltransferase